MKYEHVKDDHVNDGICDERVKETVRGEPSNLVIDSSNENSDKSEEMKTDASEGTPKVNDQIYVTSNVNVFQRRRSEEQEEVERDRMALTKQRIQEKNYECETKRDVLNLRVPIVCVFSHVDTGMTSWRDELHNTDVQEGETGGISQPIGATNVPLNNLASVKRLVPDLKLPGLLILDTPGHESFSNMRSRGSSLCDVAEITTRILFTTDCNDQLNQSMFHFATCEIKVRFLTLVIIEYVGPLDQICIIILCLSITILWKISHLFNYLMFCLFNEDTSVSMPRDRGGV